MDKELKEAMFHWLSKLETAVDKGGDFVIANAPETVRQYIQFCLVENLLLSIGLLILIPVLVTIFWKVSKKLLKRELNNEEEGICIMLLGASGVGIVPSTVGLFCCLHNFLMAWLAPNIFIIKELRNLLK